MTLLLIKESPLSALFGGKWDDPKYYRCISYRFTKYYFLFILQCRHFSSLLFLSCFSMIGAESCFFLSACESFSFLCLPILACISLLAFFIFFFLTFFFLWFLSFPFLICSLLSSSHTFPPFSFPNLFSFSLLSFTVSYSSLS
jgi:hypothetical protein